MPAKDLNKALNYIYLLLKIQFRSEAEVRLKLKNKGFEVNITDEAIQYCKRLDLINDQEFTKKWIASRLLKPLGINRIRFELKEKGVDKAIIEEELAVAFEDFSEEEIVLSLAQRRAANYKSDEPDKRRQKVIGFLMRKGFNPSVIFKVVKKI